MDGDPTDVTRAYQGAVEQADEAELSVKFGAGERVRSVPTPAGFRPSRSNKSAIHLWRPPVPWFHYT